MQDFFMKTQRAILLLAGLGALLLNTMAVATNRIRLVLEDGWVLRLSADGSELQGQPLKLQLPKDSTGVFSFQVDYPHQRLYLTPDSGYAGRGTQVYELSTLRMIGFMPGVTEVVIPVDPKAPWFTAITYTADEERMRESPIETLDQLHYDRENGEKVEFRDRNAWSKVKFKHSGSPGFAFSTWSCFSGKHKAYLAANPASVYEPEMGLRDLSPGITLEGRKNALEDGAIEACWPNGDVLLIKREIHEQHSTIIDVAKRTLSGELTKFVSDATWRLMYPDRAVVVTLGNDSRYAAYHDAAGSFALFDFQMMVRPHLGLGGNPRFGQLSTDRQEWYEPMVHYSYKGGTDWEYIASSGSLTRETSDVLQRLSTKGVPHAEKVRLPKEITEINSRLAELQNVRERQDIDDEQKQQLMDRLPPLSPLAAKIQHVGIIGAIAD
jgi:hypothetical protein